MATLTAVVHTKNSDRTLEVCLRSLTWCDEIMVVDMGSSDKTLTIAKKYATKIYTVESDLQYADPLREEYLQKVKTDWTLIVDSDEEIPEKLAQAIAVLIQKEGIDGFQLPRKNMIFGKWIEHTGFWPDYITRLFRTGKGHYPKEVHGQPVIEGPVHQLEAKPEFAIVHHHYNTIEEFLTRLNIYTTVEVEKLQAAGKTYTPLDALAAFFSQFHTRFFAEQGYKDGSTGFALSLLMGAYSMIAVLKAWELTKAESPINLEDIEDAVAIGCRGTSYWVANEEIKERPSTLKRLILGIRRKLSS